MSPIPRTCTGRTYALALLAILIGGGLTVWICYGARVGTLANPHVMHQEVGESLDEFVRGRDPRVETAAIQPGDAIHYVAPERHNLRWALVNRIPLPAPQWFRGLLQNLMQAKGGHRAFLHGRVSRTGWWYYFIVALLLKEPLPFLLLALLAIASLRVLGSAGKWRREEWFLLLPCVFLLALGMKSHIDIGIRHLLPLYPLIAIFCGRLVPLVTQLPTEGKPIRKGPAIGVIAILCGWLVIEGAIIHPLYLTYFNQIAGGPSGGNRYLVDSNLDWGQDLVRLQCAIKSHNPPIGTVGLAYFGSAEPSAYGIDWVPLDVSPGQKAKPGEAPIYGWIAASESSLAYYGGPGGGLEWLKYFKPLFTVAHTFRVYHIPLPAVKRPDIRWLRHSSEMLE